MCCAEEFTFRIYGAHFTYHENLDSFAEENKQCCEGKSKQQIQQIWELVKKQYDIRKRNVEEKNDRFYCSFFILPDSFAEYTIFVLHTNG